MLVLRRKPGQRILIGNSIEVTVLGIHGAKVRLGFVAPEEIRIYRKESIRTPSANASNEAERHVDEIAS